MQSEYYFNGIEKERLFNLLLDKNTDAMLGYNLDPKQFKTLMTKPDYFEKIIGKLNNYYYENLPEKKVMSLLLENDSRSVSAFSILAMTYFMSEFAPRIPYETKKLTYRENMESFTSDHVNDVRKIVFPITEGNVLIKPNLVSVYPYPETTDKQTLEYVVKKTRENNKSGKIFVADGPSLFFSSDLVFQDPELIEIVKKYGAELLDLNSSRFVKYNVHTDDNPADDLYLPEEIFDIDFVVNLTNFKEHNSVGISGAVKNHLGLVAPFQRLRSHREGKIAELISLVYTSLQANFNIIDSRSIMKKAQQKLYGGYEVDGDGFFYGPDAVHIDNEAKIIFLEEK
jgi:hypothetical protein